MATSNRKYGVEDVEKIYRTACREQFQWREILPDRIVSMLEVLRKCSSCPESLAVMSSLSATAALCGPGTTLDCHPSSNNISLNMFMLAVSAPGGGKSSTYDNVIAPAVDVFKDETGLPFAIETYTQAGIQSHQCISKGYGILTSDEGVRILSQIHGKQLKNEGERQFLCKTWTGKGDMSLLREKQRGYDSTALCMLLFVQPQPFLAELRNFDSQDGLMDRILFVVTLPKWFRSEIIAKNGKLYNQKYKNVFYDAYKKIFKSHQDVVTTYTLNEEAQEKYNEITDEYVQLFNRMYESDEDDRNELHCTQENTSVVTSKDGPQLGKLAVTLFIWVKAINSVLEQTPLIIPTAIEAWAVQGAHHIYNTLVKQKSIFVQAVGKSPDQLTAIMPTVRSLKDKVLKTIYKMKGPMCYPRDVNKHLKCIPASIILEEMQKLSDDGKGTMRKRGGIINRAVFFKPPPDTLDVGLMLWTNIVDISANVYEQKFKDTSHMSHADFKLLRQHPQFQDLPISVTYDDVTASESETEIVMIHSREQSVEGSQGYISGSQNNENNIETVDLAVDAENTVVVEESDDFIEPLVLAVVADNTLLVEESDDFIAVSQKRNEKGQSSHILDKTIISDTDLDEQEQSINVKSVVCNNDLPTKQDNVSKVPFVKSNTELTKAKENVPHMLDDFPDSWTRPVIYNTRAVAAKPIEKVLKSDHFGTDVHAVSIELANVSKDTNNVPVVDPDLNITQYKENKKGDISVSAPPIMEAHNAPCTSTHGITDVNLRKRLRSSTTVNSQSVVDENPSNSKKYFMRKSNVASYKS